MAKGISQEQVSEVADQLLLAGERPTIERIRQALGTGSPNTVNRFLDLWWADLGRRLTQAHHKLALPEAPTTVRTLASQLWEQALASANEHVRQEMEADRHSLAHERAILAAQHAELLAEMALLREQRLAAEQENTTAQVRIADLQRLLEQQARHLEDLTTQRDRTVVELADAQADVVALQTEQQRREMSWREERQAQEATHIAMQDRWLGEVDRARQEESKLAIRLRQAERNAEAAALKAAESIADLNKRLQSAEQESAGKTGRLKALEDEVKRLHGQLEKHRVPDKPKTKADKARVPRAS